MHSESAMTGILTTPQRISPQPASALCHTGLTPPLLLTGILVSAVRDQFSQADNIVSAELKPLIWTASPETTRLNIEPVTKWDPRNLELRPAIYVKRNGTQVERISIGDKLHGRSLIDRNQGYAVILVSSYTFFCVARAGGEAEALGTEVLLRMVEFGPAIRSDVGLKRFVIVELGGVKKLEEAKDHWVVPVVVACSYEHQWTLDPRGPKLKTVALATGQ